MVSYVGLKATSFNDGSRYAPVITASWKIEARYRANYSPVNYRHNIENADYYDGTAACIGLKKKKKKERHSTRKRRKIAVVKTIRSPYANSNMQLTKKDYTLPIHIYVVTRCKQSAIKFS